MSEPESPRVGLAELKALAESDELEDKIVQTDTMRRLERRLKYRIIDVKFRDDIGPFIIQIRPMSIAEARHLNELRTRAGPTPDVLKMRPLDDEFCHILADLCYDKKLTYEYWKKGDYGGDVPAILALAAMRPSIEDEEKIRFFQRPRRAKDSSSS